MHLEERLGRAAHEGHLGVRLQQEEVRVATPRRAARVGRFSGGRGGDVGGRGGGGVEAEEDVDGVEARRQPQPQPLRQHDLGVVASLDAVEHLADGAVPRVDTQRGLAARDGGERGTEAARPGPAPARADSGEKNAKCLLVSS